MTMYVSVRHSFNPNNIRYVAQHHQTSAAVLISNIPGTNGKINHLFDEHQVGFTKACISQYDPSVHYLKSHNIQTIQNVGFPIVNEDNKINLFGFDTLLNRFVNVSIVRNKFYEFPDSFFAITTNTINLVYIRQVACEIGEIIKQLFLKLPGEIIECCDFTDFSEETFSNIINETEPISFHQYTVLRMEVIAHYNEEDNFIVSSWEFYRGLYLTGLSLELKFILCKVDMEGKYFPYFPSIIPEFKSPDGVPIGIVVSLYTNLLAPAIPHDPIDEAINLTFDEVQPPKINHPWAPYKEVISKEKLDMKRIVIVGYKNGLASAKSIAEYIRDNTKISVLYTHRESTKYQPRKSDFIINWGISNDNMPEFVFNPVLNNPVNVGYATDKLKAFSRMEKNEVSIPNFTNDPDVVRGWLLENKVVFARTKVNGTGGEGIVIIKNEEELNKLPKCPLFVKYQLKKSEYRVHVFSGKVLYVQEKRAKTDVENINYQIRNAANGWVFCKENVDAPDCVLHEALKAVGSFGLDFGAVDVIYNELKKKAFVLEVNTAPGAEGTTSQKYGDIMINLYKQSGGKENV